MPLNQSDLELYFQKLFPARLFATWLGYGRDEYFRHREFSFTLAGDIYIRFRSFLDVGELQRDLARKKPEKIDIGGVYNVPPKLKDSSPVFQAQEKELVFDIDISDYDDIRVCCQDKGICNFCWPLMSSAAAVLDKLLREDFGYEALLFVFSGRRGLHCWACDATARRLTDEERAALVSYVNVYEGGDVPRLNIEFQLRRNALHPSLEAVYQSIIQPAFSAMFLDTTLNAQNSINQQKTADNILKLVSRHVKGFGKEHADRLSKILTQTEKPATERWRAIQKFCTDNKASWIPKFIEFSFMYPRLDVNVSKQRNHLLKAPFVVHPGTGNICVPLSLEEVQAFQPEQALTLQEVLLSYERGLFPLEPYCEGFRQFVDRCLLDAEAKASQMEVDSKHTSMSNE